MKKFTTALLIISLFLPALHAQDPFFNTENGLWDQGRSNPEGDYFSDDQGGYFINEQQYEIYRLKQEAEKEEVIANKEKAEKQKAERLEREKLEAIATSDAFLISNIVYGVGSGLLIGTWLAISTTSDTRNKFRYIGTSSILGGLVGLLIGSKVQFVAGSRNRTYSYNTSPDGALPISHTSSHSAELSELQSPVLSANDHTDLLASDLNEFLKPTLNLGYELYSLNMSF